MDRQDFIIRNLYRRSLLSYLLLPFSLANYVVQYFHKLYYSSFPTRIFHSTIPIISIGNIVSGGSGKTPFTVFLAKYLADAGKKVAVSHRDYKGKFENANQLLSDREGYLPELLEAGDEAALLAEKLKGIPVIAGRNRKQSLKILAKKYPELDYIILDDSFQHLKVFHDHDFIIFQAQAGFGNGFILPAGILREPLSALKRADFIVWNGKEPLDTRVTLFEKPIIKGHTHCTSLRDRIGNHIDLNTLQDKKLVLLSGIGFPQGFEQTIHALGLSYTHHYKMPDHYQYTDQGFLNQLAADCKSEHIDYIITTEKDFVKLRKTDFNLPLLIVEIEFIPDDDSISNFNQLL